MYTTYWSNKNDFRWFLKASRKMQQLQVTEKRKKSQLWVESKKEAYTVSQLLSLKVEQDDKYMIMKSSNSDEEYKIVSFSSDDELSEN